MKVNDRKGIAPLVVIAVIGVVGLCGMMFKPRIFSGESRRAAESKKSTEVVAKAVNAAVEVEREKGAKVAGIITEVGKANAAAPASPEREYISRDISLALAILPKADLLELIAAEKRHSAVVEGRLDVAEKLYGVAYADVKALTDRAVVAETKLNAAFADRRAVDSSISEAAAVHLAMERQRNQLVVALAALVCLGVVYRLHLVSPGALGKMAADIRAGGNPIEAMSTYTAPWLHSKVQRAAKLNADLLVPPSRTGADGTY